MEDHFCDRENDGLCDPDCLNELDKDCSGNGGKTISQIPHYTGNEPEEKAISYDFSREGYPLVTEESFSKISGRVTDKDVDSSWSLWGCIKNIFF